jgi:hypothetical protein
MTSSLIGLLAGGVISLQAAAAPAGSSQSSPGFGYCAPPLRPNCIDVDATYGDDASIKSCQDKLALYTDGVIAYRACMLRETERAVREINSAIDRFKCSASAKRLCPK